MGVGFHLAASSPDLLDGAAIEDWLGEVAAWLEAREGEPLLACRPARCDKGEPALFVTVHPGAEELEFCVPEAGHLIASAKTSTAGPGYHIFVCDLLHELGRHFGLTWHDPDPEQGTGDETGYFFDRDPQAVRQEMLRWLGALAHIVTNEEFARDSYVRMVSMPLGYSYPDQQGILTPLGPRTTDWFRAVLDDPAGGVEFFAWWHDGAGWDFFLGRALCRMWQEVRWRPPLTEAEGALLVDVHLDLERAFRLQPDAAIPWREWGEVLDYLIEYFGYAEFQHGADLEAEIRSRAGRSVGGPRIGYRRGPVQVSLTGGWSITIPGELAEAWEEQGQTWTAWYGGRGVRFTSWSVREGEDPQPAREVLDELELPEGDVIERREGPLLGRAVFCPEEQETGPWALHAYAAVDGGFARCDVLVKGRDDLAWALDIWKTLRH